MRYCRFQDLEDILKGKWNAKDMSEISFPSFLPLFHAQTQLTWLFRWEETAVMGWHDNTFSAGAVDYHRMCVADLSTPCPAQYNTPEYGTCFKALTTAKNMLFASEITGEMRRAILLAIVSSQHSSRSCEMGRVLLTAARNAITVGSRSQDAQHCEGKCIFY